MVSIARKNLFAEKTRFFVSVGGVAFSILLIIFLLGVYNAFQRLMIDYVESFAADLVVAQEGVTDMSHTFSLLDEVKMSQIESITGGRAYGLVNRATNVRVREEDGSKIIDYPGRKKGENQKAKKATISLLGFDSATGVGAPPVMIAGSRFPKKGEIIVDKVFLKLNDLALGDSIEMFDEVFTITGVTDKNNIMIYTRAFIDIKDSQEILKQKGRVNFILVALPDSSKSSEMAEKIESKIPGITVYKKSDFARSNAKAILDTFLPIIFVITIIGFATGAVVVGLTIYTATIEKIKEYGVLKAIGATNRKLFLIVFEQALWSSVLGYFIGVVLAWIVSKLVTDVINMVVVFNFQIYLLSFVAALVMSFVASLIPLRKIVGTDPAMVFRS
jgi:putative ABC transport system permease protein